jgi:hypothetical protein
MTNAPATRICFVHFFDNPIYPTYHYIYYYTPLQLFYTSNSSPRHDLHHLAIYLLSTRTRPLWSWINNIFCSTLCFFAPESMFTAFQRFEKRKRITVVLVAA